MAGSTTNLDLISSSQAAKEVTANALFDAGSPGTLYGRRATTTTALTWGYYGGILNISGTLTLIANGTVALTASATNYIEVTPSTGAVTKNTTSFTAGRIPLYQIVTGASTVTSYLDKRAFIPSAQRGQAYGVASLDSSGKIPMTELLFTSPIILPSYTTAGRPTAVVGGMAFDTTLGKMIIGVAAGTWQVVTST